MVVIVDEEKNNERWPPGAGRLPPTVTTPDRSRTPANGHRVVSSSHNGPAEMNGANYEHDAGGSVASGSGSVTSLRIV